MGDHALMKARILALLAFARWFGWRWLVVLPALALLALAARTAYDDHKTIVDLRAQLASQQGKLVAVHDQNGHKLGSVIIPQQAGDFWVNNTAITPFTIKDTGAVVRDTFSTTHGLFTAGGGGSDMKAAIGPMVGSETTYGSLYLLQPATIPSGVNPAMWSEGSNLGVNAPVGTIYFYQGGIGGTQMAAMNTTSLTLTNIQLVQFGSGIATGTIGTNKAGAGLQLQADAAANVMALYGGTQNTIALGANLSTSGHIRTPSGWMWQSRRADNSANNNTMYDDGLNDLYIGNSGYTIIGLGNQGPTTINIETSSAGITHMGPGATDYLQLNGTTAAASLGATSGVTVALVGTVTVTTRTITGNLTVDTTTTDYEIIVDTSAGVVTVTLPTPTNGRQLVLIDKKNTFGTNSCTLARHGSEKINGVAASKVLSANGYRGTITSDGTDWYLAIGGLPLESTWPLVLLGLALARRRADNDVMKDAA